MQHLQKNRGGWGVLLLTSSLCFPTFKRAFNRPLFSIASTLFHFPYPVTPLLACPPWRATPTKTAGCVPTISILELNLEICPGQSLLLFICHQSRFTSHKSPIPLSQTEQAGAPSLMHIITAASSLPLGPGDRSFPSLGGRHEGQAPHHPYCRRRFDRPGSHRAVLDSRQPVPSHHRRKSFRRARPQSATRQHEPLAAERFALRRKSFHRRRFQIQFFAVPHGQVPQGRCGNDSVDFLEDPERHRRHH